MQVVLAAVQQSGKALVFAEERWRNDRKDTRRLEMTSAAAQAAECAGGGSGKDGDVVVVVDADDEDRDEEIVRSERYQRMLHESQPEWVSDKRLGNTCARSFSVNHSWVYMSGLGCYEPDFPRPYRALSLFVADRIDASLGGSERAAATKRLAKEFALLRRKDKAAADALAARAKALNDALPSGG